MVVDEARDKTQLHALYKSALPDAKHEEGAVWHLQCRLADLHRRLWVHPKCVFGCVWRQVVLTRAPREVFTAAQPLVVSQPLRSAAPPPRADSLPILAAPPAPTYLCGDSLASIRVAYETYMGHVGKPLGASARVDDERVEDDSDSDRAEGSAAAGAGACSSSTSSSGGGASGAGAAASGAGAQVGERVSSRAPTSRSAAAARKSTLSSHAAAPAVKRARRHPLLGEGDAEAEEVWAEECDGYEDKSGDGVGRDEHDDYGEAEGEEKEEAYAAAARAAPVGRKRPREHDTARGTYDGVRHRT